MVVRFSLVICLTFSNSDTPLLVVPTVISSVFRLAEKATLETLRSTISA
jgi:hypothetical protein